MLSQTIEITPPPAACRAVIVRLPEDGPDVVNVPRREVRPRAVATMWRYGRWIGVLFLDPVGPQDEVTVTIEAATPPGDPVAGVRPPIQPQRLDWFAVTGSAPDPEPGDYDPLAEPAGINLAGPATAGGHAPGAAAGANPVGALQRWIRTLERHFIDRQRFDDMAGAARVRAVELFRAAAMFRELDFYTRPDLLESSRRRVLPGARARCEPWEVTFRTCVAKQFMRRFIRRLRSVITNGPASSQPFVDDASTETVRPWLQYLSGVQLEIYRRWYDWNTRSGLAGMQRAMANFGSGRLLLDHDVDPEFARQGVVVVPEGSPDSIAVFAFAEFAIAALEAKVDRDDWYGLLPVILAMLEAYKRAFGKWVDGCVVALPQSSYWHREGDHPLRPLQRLSREAIEDIVTGAGGHTRTWEPLDVLMRLMVSA